MTEIQKRFFNELLATILLNIDEGNLSEVQALLRFAVKFGDAMRQSTLN